MRWPTNSRFFLQLLAPLLAIATPPDVKAIIAKSVQANHIDFNAAPHYNNKEEDSFGYGSKTYQVTMIEGSPYRRLLAINGKPLPPDQEKRELEKEAEVRRERHAETPAARRARIAKFERSRLRDSAMMSQLTKAFNFAFEGEETIRNHRVFVLKATPRAGYQPPNRDCEVLPGMEGKLWIDQESFHWVQVMAEVLRPVSISGFLATVEPGTRFELQKEPVGDGKAWLASDFEMKSSAKVLYVFNRNSQEKTRFWDYQKAD